MTTLATALAAAAVVATIVGPGGPRRRLGLRPPPVAARLLLVAAGAGTVPAWWLAGGEPIQLLVAAAAAGCAARVLRARRRRWRRSAAEADVVALCFGAAAELRAGRSPGDALSTVGVQLGPLSDGVQGVGRAVRRGAPVDRELVALADESRSRRLRTVAAVWAAVASTGAGSADVLDRVAQAFSADDEARAELGALAAGPRATALVLCALPLVALALAAAVGSDPAAVLLGSPFGWLLTTLAAVLDGCGLLWVRAITTRALAG